MSVTTSTGREVERRRVGAPRKPRTIAGAWALEGRAILEEWAMTTPAAWPSNRYRQDPVAFFREVLGVEPWSKQVEVITAIRDHKRVAVRSGHKVSKSHTAAGVALWYFSSFEDARVIMTSTTSRQVDQILWRELKMMHARSGRCVACKKSDTQAVARGARPGERPCPHSAILDGDREIPELARTGLKTKDFREIVGFTARESEAVAGISGKNILYLVDEASGVPDIIFEAIEGNRAGGARIVLFGNPTRNEGEHFEAFEGSKRDAYFGITISSTDTPNAVSGEERIPGLATREWCEERAAEWGKESALYIIRVEGRHALHEEGRIISIHLITESQARWSDDPKQGRLHIGLDPAGPSGKGDETVFAVRRGSCVLELLPFRGLSDEDHLAHLLGIISAHTAKGGELPPIVKVDREGLGSRLYGFLSGRAQMSADGPPAFELVGVASSQKARREPNIYHLLADELWANLARWLRDGGAIPEDVKLAKELHTPEWKGDLSGRLRVTPKEGPGGLREKLGRSPDRADAVALAVWEAPHIEQDAVDRAAPPAVFDAYDAGGPGGIDPYAIVGGGVYR